ncbi:MAG: VTT domain-containing protein [Chloroflexi bacterium]|nr:VTT domain-containing protein [Chloroflexota bacterium]
MATKTSFTISRAIILLIVVALSIFIFTIPEEQAKRLEAFGFLGIFLLLLLSNATLFLPVPGLIFVFSMGAQFNPLGVALAAGSGATIGELSGYIAGYSGHVIVDENEIYDRMVRWMQRNGGLTVLALAFIPNPLFDITGIAAGALKMPVWKFLGWAWIGKTFKMLLTALAGAGILSIPLINDLFAP